MNSSAKKYRVAALALLGALTAAHSAEAQISVGGNDPALIQFGAGGFDVLHNYTAGMFRGEYRFGEQIFVLTPLIGAEVTTKGTLYGYGGFGVDIHIGDSWVATPNEAVGIWYRGDGKELGSAIEFRSGGDVDYVFGDGSRLGASFHHISNAGIGKHNPGEEEALAVYAIPLGGL